MQSLSVHLSGYLYTKLNGYYPPLNMAVENRIVLRFSVVVDHNGHNPRCLKLITTSYCFWMIILLVSLSVYWDI